MTFQQWLTQAITRLSQSESPRRDAEILLGHVTGKARTFILAFDETTLTEQQNRLLIWWGSANSGRCRCLSLLRR